MEKSEYKTLGEWRKADKSAFNAAIRNGIINEICDMFGWEQIKPKPKLKKHNWTKESCIEEAKKYESISLWQKNNMSCYQYAHKNGLKNECTAHMVNGLQKPKGYWLLKENCIEDAKRFNTLKEWVKKSSSSYQSAKKNNWYHECSAHMEMKTISLPGFWTKKRCIEEAKICKTKKNFSKNLAALTAAKKNGWYEECCLYLTGIKLSLDLWTKEEVLSIAKKHTNRIDWINENKQSYRMACRNKWIDECTAHMSSRSKWSYENCKVESLKYENISHRCSGFHRFKRC